MGHERDTVDGPSPPARRWLTVKNERPLTRVGGVHVAYTEVIYAVLFTKGRVMLVEGRLKDLVVLQAGAQFSVWPSLYEPAGAATEPLAVGTAMLCRGVGGLPRQVRCSEGGMCGICYRETAPLGSEWRKLQNTFSPDARRGTNVHTNGEPRLYDTMIGALVEQLQRAVEIRVSAPARYATMLARTSQQVEDPFFAPSEFSRKYWRVYGVALNQADFIM